MSYVRAEAILVLKNLLRKYPERRQGVVEVLPRLLRVVEESEAKVRRGGVSGARAFGNGRSAPSCTLRHTPYIRKI